jgi:hypothetical protein
VTVEGSPYLDISALRRKGVLAPNTVPDGAFSWSTWYEEAEATFTLTAGPECGFMVLRIAGEADQHIHLISAPAPFGGRRWLFACPVRHFSVCRLYRPPGGRRFASRQAWRLVYTSTRQAAHDRALHRAQALRIRLGGDPALDMPPPKKPKWMRWPTYERHLAELERLEAVTEAHLVGLIARLGDDDWLKQYGT